MQFSDGWPGKLIGLMAIFLPCQAYALCEVVSTSPAGFGSMSSIAVRTTSQPSSTTNAGLSCTGSLLSLLATNDHFYATVTSTQTGLLGPTGDVIGYTLYANSSTNYPLTRGVAFDFARNGIIDALGLLGSEVPKTVPIYLGTTIGSNVAAGIYSETLSIAWDWNYCSGIGIGNICLGRDISSGNTTLTVNMTVVNDCTITAPNISFGSASMISTFATVTGQTINLACTKGSAYTVGLDDGQHAVGVGGRRQMISGSNYLAYDIFKSAGTTRWGSVSTARRTSSDAEVNPGNGLGTGSQIFNYNAKIYTDQSTPPPGTYLDSVVLDVGF
ncbi:spore coat protein U domain-containing protein [Erwinia sp. TH29]|uniref:Csu type fimbrial protein n=2 Tax=Gammaproteobacteria TaxID=1236 RepID=UPI00191472FD|nr:spore coat protein U domain-containing protein [Bacillus sp. TH86]MBK5318589.1 spore coat protein U domain-containing protein [Erwinia sp. TH79]MBK5324091.1 spore coat protein U domain-containing protein [Bacillus sp. TH59]MBK5339041.1 spore coat protein U domain-containing protein [Bacillus sp. TH57]MBK5423449.1 spore coat protein U domain-containing protein [Erwinia sp. TH29]